MGSGRNVELMYIQYSALHMHHSPSDEMHRLHENTIRMRECTSATTCRPEVAVSIGGQADEYFDVLKCRRRTHDEIPNEQCDKIFTIHPALTV